MLCKSSFGFCLLCASRSLLTYLSTYSKKLVLRASFSVVILATTATVYASANVHHQAHIAEISMASSVSINESWARATFALAKSGAAYFSITNTSNHDLVLSSVSVDNSVAMTAELHHTIMQNEMMSMQELEDGIEIKAGSTVELSPGGMHIMFMGLQKPLNKDEFINVNLIFEDGSQLSHSVPVLDKRN